jgi:hypothetical protein
MNSFNYCVQVMTIVSKQIGDEVDLKEEGLKLAIKGKA